MAGSPRERIQQALSQPWLQRWYVARLAQNEMAVRGQNWCEGKRAHESVLCVDQIKPQGGERCGSRESGARLTASRSVKSISVVSPVLGKN